MTNSNQKIFSFVNEDWRLLLELFQIKTLTNPQEVLKINKAILLVSDDLKNKISPLKDKLDKNEVIVVQIPAHKNSLFDKHELKSLMIKALGIS